MRTSFQQILQRFENDDPMDPVVLRFWNVRRTAPPRTAAPPRQSEGTARVIDLAGWAHAHGR